MTKHSEVLTAAQASHYLKINNGLSDGLKKSRKTGRLWGERAPCFIKAKRKALYRKLDLDEFLAKLPRYHNNREVKKDIKFTSGSLKFLPLMLFLRRWCFMCYVLNSCPPCGVW